MLALIVIDDHSRFRISCKLFTHIETKDVTEELLRCFHMYKCRPKKILVDHGPQFRDMFKKWCEHMDVKEVVYAPCSLPSGEG